MSEYRVKDLVLVPNLLSAARVPLAVAFPLAAGNATVALGILGFAGLTDILDGWAARKLGQATPVGALVDGVSDKVFAASVLGTLVATGMLSPVAALLLATRELGELPLAVRVVTSKRARLTELDRKANRLGKVATVLEFATVLAVIAKVPGKNVLLAATCVCGAAAAATYWWREIRAARSEATVQSEATARSEVTARSAVTAGSEPTARSEATAPPRRSPPSTAKSPLPLRVASMALPPPSSRAPSSVSAPA